MNKMPSEQQQQIGRSSRVKSGTEKQVELVFVLKRQLDQVYDKLNELYESIVGDKCEPLLVEDLIDIQDFAPDNENNCSREGLLDNSLANNIGFNFADPGAIDVGENNNIFITEDDIEVKLDTSEMQTGNLAGTGNSLQPPSFLVDNNGNGNAPVTRQQPRRSFRSPILRKGRSLAQNSIKSTKPNMPIPSQPKKINAVQKSEHTVKMGSSRSRLKHTKPNEHRPFKCDKCELAFKIKGNLTVHQNVHEGRRFECTFEGCAVSYSTQARLRKHIQIVHTKEAPLLRCSFDGCKYSTYNNEYLQMHLVVHSDHRPYKCSQCDQTFKTSPCLHKHRLSHENLRRYKCTYEGCHYAANQCNNLTRHQKFVHGMR